MRGCEKHGSFLRASAVLLSVIRKAARRGLFRGGRSPGQGQGQAAGTGGRDRGQGQGQRAEAVAEHLPSGGRAVPNTFPGVLSSYETRSRKQCSGGQSRPWPCGEVPPTTRQATRRWGLGAASLPSVCSCRCRPRDRADGRRSRPGAGVRSIGNRDDVRGRGRCRDSGRGRGRDGVRGRHRGWGINPVFGV